MKDCLYAYLLGIHYKSPNTIKIYQYAISNFIATLTSPNIEDIPVEAIEAYLLQLQARKYKATTINLSLRALQAFYNFLNVEYGIANVASKVRALPEAPPNQRILTKPEYALICTKVNGYHLDCIKFLCASGLRVSEFTGLQPEYIGQDFIRVINGKGRKARSIPLNKTLQEVLSRNPRLEFIKHRNRLWVFRICRETAVMAEIPPFSPHSCRHYFSNELYKAGVPIATISRLLGHSCSMVTERVYIHWSEESLAGTTDALD